MFAASIPLELALCQPAAASVKIPGGLFTRGQKTSIRPDEIPPHEVQLSPFYIDATLVTRADFAKFVAATGYKTTAEKQGWGVGASEGMNDWEWERIPRASWRRPFWEQTPDHAAFLRDDAPVVMVSFFDAEAYCRHQNQRLPTEAEWEYAMRAQKPGAPATRYPWGDAPELTPGHYGLNFWQGASHKKNARLDGYVYVSPVRAFSPNAWGIYDAVGNVWQWTADFYAEDTYLRLALGPAQGRIDPKGPPFGQKRVLRGGSWWCGACTCEGNGLFYRGKSEPGAAYNNIGFRCAKSAP